MTRKALQRNHSPFRVSIIALWSCIGLAQAEALKVHSIFTSNMVIQRDKPIVIWGWADNGSKVTVKFGDSQANAVATGDEGGWEVTFPAREASVKPSEISVTTGEEVVRVENILIGDVWVMNGQSNMAWGLGKTLQVDMETAQAHLPLLRKFGISPNEQPSPQNDIPADKIDDGGWVVASPETAAGFSAIGYVFASNVQRALQIPIGIIDNARGGASIESLVPHHKFDDHPLARHYDESVDKRRAEFDMDTQVAKMVEKWEKKVAQDREKALRKTSYLPSRPLQTFVRGTYPVTAHRIPRVATMACSACSRG